MIIPSSLQALRPVKPPTREQLKPISKIQYETITRELTPEELKQYQEIELAKEKERQLTEIDSRINKYQERVNYYNKIYDTSTGEKSYNADLQRTRYQAYIDELNKVKVYATGEYDLNSILGYAMDVATSKWERTQPRPLVKKELPEPEKKITQIPKETTSVISKVYSKENLITTREGVKKESEVYPAIKKIITPPSNVLTKKLKETENTIYKLPELKLIELPYQKRGTIITAPKSNVPTDYNELVKQYYKAEVSKIPIKEEYKLSLEVGKYSSKKGLTINKFFSPLKDTIIKHEVGHKLDFSQLDVKDYLKYKEASKNYVPDILENIGYNKKNIGQEYYSRAFTNYIKNPQKFKNEYPEIAGEFEKRLNVPVIKEQSEVKLISTISPTKEISKIEQLGYKLETQRARGKNILPITSLGLFGLYYGKSLLYDIPKSAYESVRHPVQTAKGIIGILKEPIKYGEQIGTAIKRRPEQSSAEIFAFFTAPKVYSKIPTELNIARTRLSPKYVKTTKEAITNIPSITGETKEIPIAKELGKIKEPLTKQVKIAGQKTDVVSAQRNLFGVFEKEKEIRKPIPSEEKLSIATKELLKKLDEGKITERQISELNKRIIKETGSKGLLETSFFGDPYGRIRVSRLGVLEETPKATLKDLFSGNVRFRKEKPQVLLFEEQQIAKFPDYLKPIEKKLLEGRGLTEIEKSKLLKWQMQKTGEFKPVGFLSKEPEVTLPKGEIIVKKETPAVTLIGRKRVEIIRPEIKTQTKKISGIIEELKRKDLSEKKRIKKYKELQEETGIGYYEKTKPYYEPTRLISPLMFYQYKPKQQISEFSIITKSTDYKQPVSKISIMPEVQEYKQPISTFSIIPSYQEYKSPITQVSIMPTYQRYAQPQPSPIIKYLAPRYTTPRIIYPEEVTFKLEYPEKERYKKESYIPEALIESTKPKRRYWKKLSNTPMTKKSALSIASEYVDKTISARGRIIKVKSDNPIDTKENYFELNRQKFRTFQQKKGRRISLPNSFIERAKYRADYPTEVQTLQKARRTPFGF